MSKLRISDNLAFPLEFVTQTQAILAMRRRGKTYTASVQAEELLKAGQQIVVIDITGAWWGLKSSADGKSEAFNIVVAGGEHADIPLNPDAGGLLAQAIVGDRFSCILDLKLLRKGQRMQFLAAFLETFHSLNRFPVHVFADEADDYIPQTIMWKEPNASKCLGAMDDMVRRGGINGIGCTLITQRPAVINKDVLTQTQILTLLRINHPADMKPIREWVRVHATVEEEAKVMSELPLLALGQAIVWAPGWPEDHPIGIRHIQVRERETFNSSRTPKPGEQIVSPRRLARPDLDKLGARIRELAEKAKADDPRELRKRIAEFERQLRERPAETRTIEVEKLVEVPVLKNGQLERTEKILARVEAIGEKAMAEVAELRKLIEPARPKGPLVQPPPAIRPRTVIQLLAKREEQSAESSRSVKNESGTDLPRGEKAILTACAQYDDGATREQLTVLTGYKRSSRDTYLQRLRERGFIQLSGHDHIVATPDGIEALGAGFQPLPTGLELRRHWLARLPEGERKILELLIDSFPEQLRRDELDEPTGYKRSSRDTYLQRLGAKRLVEFGSGTVRASEELF